MSRRIVTTGGTATGTSGVSKVAADARNSAIGALVIAIVVLALFAIINGGIKDKDTGANASTEMQSPQTSST